MATRIFSTRLDDDAEDDVTSALRTYENWEYLGDETIVFIDEEFLLDYNIYKTAGVEEYIAVFTDDKKLYEGCFQKYVCDLNSETCRIGGTVIGECVIIIYEIKNLETPSNDELIEMFCGDIAAASVPIISVGTLDIDEKQLQFFDGMMERYLFYLDQLTNYIQFQKKMGATFDIIFRKVKEFNLKFIEIRNDIRNEIAEVKKLEQNSDNPRPALIVRSIYESLDFDEYTMNNRIQNLNDSISEISEYTRSVNELRQASMGESLNNIMFWIAIISFFFGMIAIYDKYQSSNTFNLPANEAFFYTGFLMFPFALLFIWAFLRNGSIFESAGRFIKNFKFKARSNSTIRSSKLLWRDYADLDWYEFVEAQTTNLALDLLPKGNRIQKQLKDDLKENDYDTLRNIYSEQIYPQTSIVYATLYREISEKLQSIVLEKKNLNPLSSRKQLDSLIAEVSVFTALTNLRLEVETYIEEGNFRALNLIGLSVFFEVFKDEVIEASDMTDFDTPWIALKLEYSSYYSYKDYMPLARYLAAQNPKIKLLFNELEEVSSVEEEFVPARTVLLLALLDRDDYEFDSYPEWLPSEYVNLRLDEDGSPTSKLAEIKKEYSQEFRNGILCINVLKYINDYCNIKSEKWKFGE